MIDYRANLNEEQALDIVNQIDFGGDNECWNWTGTLNSYGYGKAGRSKTITRIVMKPSNPGEFVLHRCDNPACVNPNHLYLGTQLDNMRDRVRRGRHPEQQKTHCPQGHEYDEANTYRYKNRRGCRDCHRESVRKYDKKKK